MTRTHRDPYLCAHEVLTAAIMGYGVARQIAARIAADIIRGKLTYHHRPEIRNERHHAAAG